jgi:hypothetical protein
MPYQIQDFEREYAGKSNDDLLRLAWAPQDLVDDAKIALHTELSRRGLKADDIDTAQFEQEKHEEEQERKAANQLLQAQWRGIGFKRFCKWDRTCDPESRTEEFTTTRFFVLFQLPLIPLGTYRVRRKKGLFQKPEILEKLPLNWTQVLWVWMLSLLAILALILVARYGLPFFNRT